MDFVYQSIGNNIITSVKYNVYCSSYHASYPTSAISYPLPFISCLFLCFRLPLELIRSIGQFHFKYDKLETNKYENYMHILLLAINLEHL